MRILTVGIKNFNDVEFAPVVDVCLNKPDFGSRVLWGSSMIKVPGGSITSEWKNFVGSSSCLIEKDVEYGISYTLHKNAKILEISDINDYIMALQKYSIPICYKIQLDFSKICHDYDAFHLTSDAAMDLHLFWYSKSFWEDHGVSVDGDDEWDYYRVDDFNSYDVESWIIFNAECINKGSILTHNNIQYSPYLYDDVD